LLSILTLACSAGAATNYPPVEVDMDLTRVSTHVWYVQGAAGIATDNAGFISNSAAVITDEGIVIVDALGSPSLAQLMLEKIRAISDKPVVKVIVTHYHADHVYGLQLYRELGAKILAPAGYHEYLEAPIAEERLEERRLSLDPWVNDDTRLVPPDEIIDADQEFTLGGVSMKIIYFGAAHSDGDMALLVKNDKVLISGDLIFEGRIPFTGGSDTRHWMETLAGLDRSNLTTLVPGHGPAVENPAETVSLTLRYLTRLREVMAPAVDDMESFAEAFEAADWSEFEHLPAFEAAHRINAYGVYLSLEREVME